MSTWRKKALESLPELRAIVQTSNSPMALWIELYRAFEQANKSDNLNLADRIFRYAQWSTSEEAGPLPSDASTAALLAFFEHLPADDNIRRRLPRWLSQADFQKLTDIFRYHLSEKAYKQFVTEFRQAKKH
jgi:hypothetical protein